MEKQRYWPESIEPAILYQPGERGTESAIAERQAVADRISGKSDPNLRSCLIDCRWFTVGLVAGGVVTVRALRRRPAAADLRSSATATAADVLDLLSRAVRPKSGRVPL